MPEIDPNVRPATRLGPQHERGIVEDLAFGLKSIPHLPRALMRGMNEPGISPEESELRRRSMAEAAQLILPALVTGGAAIMAGPMAPLVAAVVGAASEAAGAGIAASIKGEDVIPSALVGGLAGGVLGGLPAVYAGKKLAGALAHGAADAGEAVAKGVEHFPKGSVTRALDGTVELSSEAYKVGPRPPSLANEIVPEAPVPHGPSTFDTRSPSSLTKGSRIVYPKGPIRINKPVVDQDLFTTVNAEAALGPLFSGKPAQMEARQVAQRLSGAESNIISDIPTPPKGGAGSAFSPDQGIAATSAAARSAIAGPKATSGFIKDMVALGHRALAPARVSLMRMGEAGGKMAQGLDEAFTAWRMRSGDDIAMVEKVLAPFSKDERHHIGEIMEGLTPPRDVKYSTAAEHLDGIYEKYAHDAHGMGMREYFGEGDIRDFASRSHYMTHYYDPKTVDRMLKPNTSEYRRAMAWIEGHTQARTVREKEALLRRILDPKTSEFRTGPINHPRSALMEGMAYEKDPLKVMSRYIYSVSKRLEVARRFGAKDELKNTLLSEIAGEGGDAHVAGRIYAAFNDQLPSEYEHLVRATGTYNVLTMLSTSGIVQPAQLLNTAAVAGYGNVIKAIGMIQTKAGKDWARTTGAYVHETMQELAGFADNGPANWWVRAIGLEPLDKANRAVSALAGRLHAEQTARAFVAKPKALLAQRLQELGLDPILVKAQGGVLTNDQLRRAAFQMATDTQFSAHVMDLPEFRNNWAGKMIYQFKSFALQQTYWLMDPKKGIFPKFVKAMTGQPGGDAAPFLRFAAGLGPVGYTIGSTIRAIKGRPAPDDPNLKTLENLAMVGAFGVFYDTWQSLADGPGGFLSLLTGPAAGELANFVGEVPKAIKGDPEALAKHIVRRIPGIGQPLANYFLFPRE